MGDREVRDGLRVTRSVWLAIAAATYALATSCSDGDARPGQGEASGGSGAGGTGSGQEGGESSGSGNAGSGGLALPGGAGSGFGGAGAGAGAGSGGGGEGGAVPEGAEHDPALCACDYNDYGPFDVALTCTADLGQLTERMGELSCDTREDINYVTRTECANGVVKHLMLEGSENDYGTTTQGGVLVAAAAFGYVSGLCGADANNMLTVRAGEEPEATDCVTCQVCGDSYDSEGDAGAAGGPSTFSGFPPCAD